MKSILLLSALLLAASAAPAELQAAPEAAAVSQVEDVAAVEEAAAESPMEDMAAVEEAAAESPMEDSAVAEASFNFCPQGWLSYGARCFKFVNSALTWYNAEEHCNSLGGHLASVTNPQEYNYLQQMVQLTGQTTVWLGGFALQGRWMWIDRQGFYYNNWYTQSSTTTHPCLHLRSTTGWSNSQCTTGLRFICSKSPFGC